MTYLPGICCIVHVPTTDGLLLSGAQQSEEGGQRGEEESVESFEELFSRFASMKGLTFNHSVCVHLFVSMLLLPAQLTHKACHLKNEDSTQRR